LIRSRMVKIDKKRNFGGFFKTYFIIIIILVILDLVDSLFITGSLNVSSILLTRNTAYIVWILFLLLVGLAEFVLSIIAIITFVKRKIPKISLVVPIIILATTIFFIFSGAIAGPGLTVEGYVSSWVTVSSIIINIVVLIFSILMLINSKFK